MNNGLSQMATKRFRPGFRFSFWVGVSFLLVLLIVYAFWPRAIQVETGHVTRGELVVEVQAEGRTRVRELYVVTAPLTGHLQRIGNRTGEDVQKGDVVAVLDPSEAVLLDPRSRAEAEAALDSASAVLGLARAQLAEAEAVRDEAAKESSRLNELFKKQVVARSAVDTADMNLETASARVDAARAAVARAQADREGARLRLEPSRPSGNAKRVRQLTAPASGKILRVHAQSETAISAGAPILEIGDPSELEVVAEFLSADAATFNPGAEVRLTGWGGPDLSGRVRSVEPSGYLKISALGVEEQRVNVIIDFDQVASAGTLADGFRVDAAVTVWSSVDVLQVPVSALFREQGSWSVFRISDGRAILTRIELGEQNQNQAAIISGLSEGDIVVLYPDRSLRDGQRVRGRAS